MKTNENNSNNFEDDDYYKSDFFGNRENYMENLNIDFELFCNANSIKKEICFCHSFKCKKLKHFIVLRMYGHMSYVNIGIWKRQIKYLIKLNKNRLNEKNDNTVNVYIFFVI